MYRFIFASLSSIIMFVYSIITVNILATPNEQQVLSPVTDQPKAQQNLSINILQSQSEFSMPLSIATEYFTKLNSDIKINIQTISNHSDYQMAVRSKLLAGEKIDLFSINSYRDTKMLEQYLLDLSGIPWVSTATKGSLESVTLDGKILGIPSSIEGVGLIVNKSIFLKADINIEEILTFEDMQEAFKSLQAKIDAQELASDYPDLVAVSEFSAGDKVFLSEYIADIVLGNSLASPTLAPTSSMLEFTDPSASEEFIKLMAFNTSNKSNWPELAKLTQNAQLENGLATGRVAVVVQNSNVYSKLIKINPQLKNQLAILPIPLPNMESGAIYTGVPAYWAINSKSEPQNINIAKDFITWLYHTEAGAEMLADNFNIISPYSSATAGRYNPVQKQVVRYIEQDKFIPQIHRELSYDFLIDSFAPNIQKYFIQRDYSWEKFTSDCKESWIPNNSFN